MSLVKQHHQMGHPLILFQGWMSRNTLMLDLERPIDYLFSIAGAQTGIGY
jgi:hypothetical protein